MKRLTAPALLLAIGLAGVAAPAAAQDDTSDNVNLVIVYGDDECTASADPSVISVCVRMEESERYRIPPNLRESSSPANEAWANRVQSFETVGAHGINSCSPSGYAGFTGCTKQLIDQAYAEKREAPAVRAAQLIAEERDKRLAKIDEQAADEQARVEAIEKEYEARRRAEEEAAAAAADQ